MKNKVITEGNQQAIDVFTPLVMVVPDINSYNFVEGIPTDTINDRCDDDIVNDILRKHSGAWATLSAM